MTRVSSNSSKHYINLPSVTKLPVPNARMFAKTHCFSVLLKPSALLTSAPTLDAITIWPAPRCMTVHAKSERKEEFKVSVISLVFSIITSLLWSESTKVWVKLE